MSHAKAIRDDFTITLELGPESKDSIQETRTARVIVSGYEIRNSPDPEIPLRARIADLFRNTYREAIGRNFEAMRSALRERDAMRLFLAEERGPFWPDRFKKFCDEREIKI